MRFVRLLAAAAALLVSSLSGHAIAAMPIVSTSGTFTPDPSGNAALTIVLFDPAVNSATKIGTHLTLSAAASGYFSFFADGNYYVTDPHGNLFDANNLDFGGGGSFANTRTAGFIADLPRFYNMQTSFWWLYQQPTIYVGLTGLAAPVDYKLTVKSFGVPEPSTWALMIVGMGAIGVAMRRRIRSSSLRPA